MEKFPEQQFVMVASLRDEGLFYDIMEKSKRLPNLKVVTNVSYHDIDSYYQRAKLSINTSEEEGFPNTFIESLKWGVPLASLSVNPDRCITQCRLGIFGENDFDLFIEMIKDFLRQPKLMDACSTRGYTYAKKEFSGDIINKWINFLNL